MKTTKGKNIMATAMPALDMTSMSREELMEALQSEKEKNDKQIVVKVSPKGCVQVNGIRKFPITFYKDEWATLFSLRERIESFITENEGALANKA